MCRTTKNISSTIKNNHAKIPIREDTYFGEVWILGGLAFDGIKSSWVSSSKSEKSSSESKSIVNLVFAVKKNIYAKNQRRQQEKYLIHRLI